MGTCRATQSVGSECGQSSNPVLPYTEAWGSQAPNFQQGCQQERTRQAGRREGGREGLLPGALALSAQGKCNRLGWVRGWMSLSSEQALHGKIKHYMAICPSPPPHHVSSPGAIQSYLSSFPHPQHPDLRLRARPLEFPQSQAWWGGPNGTRRGSKKR